MADLVAQSGVRGGLIVHVNCGDATLSATLRVSDACTVHGLDAQAENVATARKNLRNSDQLGPVSVERWQGKTLPYVDNLVNLIVVSPGEITIPDSELTRVLAPGGVGIRLDPETRNLKPETLLRKPWPDEMGQWTHYQFDAHNNAVGTDRLVGPPRHFQWSGGPLWSTAHENMASLSAMVSAGGRVFCIIDEGPRASSLLPADWQLVGRDAFNGVVLWKRPMQRWLTRQWPWKSGPAQMPRKLVAVGDRVYAPLDINGPLVQLDAATGEILHTYEGTAAAEEVICADGVLLVMTNPAPPDQAAIDVQRRQRRHFDYDSAHRVVLDHDVARKIVAVRADTGELLWQHDGPRVLPMTLASDGQIAAYHNGERIVARDLTSGNELWASEPITGRLRMASEDAPTLVIYDQVVLLAWDRKLTAVSKRDGRTLWGCNWTQADYRSPVSVMVLGGKVWSMDITGMKSPGTFIGRDPLTGEVSSQFDLPPFQGIGHHRCYKAKATGDCVLLSRSGVEFVDPFEQTYQEHHWVRGACLYGILPCNGLLYATPHPCACYIKGKLSGFVALAPGGSVKAEGGRTKGSREMGPAYEPLILILHPSPS
jgi:outer membrane protein assembly factor BamB